MSDDQSRGLQVQEVSHSFGRAGAAGVDLDVADGEFVTFLGPSGCGRRRCSE